MDKKVTINPKNAKDNNCFQYAIIAALNYQNIGHHLERISKLEPFINKYNCKDTEFPWRSKDLRTFECNNMTVALFGTADTFFRTASCCQIFAASSSTFQNSYDCILVKFSLQFEQ